MDNFDFYSDYRNQHNFKFFYNGCDEMVGFAKNGLGTIIKLHNLSQIIKDFP